jgi:hypothetical protein
MAAASFALFAIGGIIMVIASFTILIKAFQTSVLWGLGYIIVPFVGLIFVILYWQETKKPFLYLVGGAALFFVGTMLGVPASELAAN